MKRFVIFRPMARAEYDHEVAYYEKQQKDLGKEFSAVIDECLTEIVFTPLRYAAVVDDIRECLVPRFPFAIYFRVIKNTVIVLSVHHTSRDPSRWQSRR
jgi:toxin ParE1/3/4